VVTFEFENVSSACAEAAAEFAPVRPAYSVLHTTQNRKREKQFLASRGIPVAPFATVDSLEALERAISDVGLPAVLKTAGFGYDGKGQHRISSGADPAAAWKVIGGREAVLESFIDFEQEVSVVAARGIDGSFAHFGVVANEHHRHILDVTTAPAALEESTRHQAIDIARSVLEELEVVGVLCVEFFVSRAGRLIVNEIAPRPHNSGHFTIDACITCQFEQQLRAVCGLPLGSPEQLRPAAMANLLGDLWSGGEPDWASLAALGDIKLHLYGKTAARPGRKMGHLTALASTASAAASQVRMARSRLTGGIRPS
jgi:5-(carboxyamino)imidazole ribonucleotide synthase